MNKKPCVAEGVTAQKMACNELGDVMKTCETRTASTLFFMKLRIKRRFETWNSSWLACSKVTRTSAVVQVRNNNVLDLHSISDTHRTGRCWVYLWVQLTDHPATNWRIHSSLCDTSHFSHLHKIAKTFSFTSRMVPVHCSRCLQ